MANPFVHIELQTSDLKKAKDFYGKLFDWKLEDTPMPELRHLHHDRRGRRHRRRDDDRAEKGAPSQWIPYVDVSDVDSSTKRRSSSAPRSSSR